ncbi:MAG: DinB family protein [Acidobacteria bacterium]|nr:DinB family protein [Acidobacteriota bacterium]
MRTALALCLFVAPLLPAAELSSQEKSVLVKHLQRTAKELLLAVKALTPEQLSFKATLERWSVAECVEHIALSETFLRGIADKTLASHAKTEGLEARKASDAKMLAMVPDRTQRFQTPEPLKPAGKFAEVKVGMAEFNRARKANFEYVKTTTADLRAHVAPHPVLKEMDVYQWLLTLSAHTERHTKQILELKADSKFPK